VLPPVGIVVEVVRTVVVVVVRTFSLPRPQLIDKINPVSIKKMKTKPVLFICAFPPCNEEIPEKVDLETETFVSGFQKVFQRPHE
jgi:hypothetical protein